MGTMTRLFEAVLALIGGFSVIYDCATSWLIARRRRESIPAPRPRPAVTFFRPIKPGVPRLAEKLSALVEATAAGDQLLFGADPGRDLEICCEVAERFSAREIVVVPCAPARAANPKISKLIQMAPSARHEYWITSDAETSLSADFVEAFCAHWREADVVTAPYRFRGARTLPQQLDSAAALLTLWPGITAAQRLGPLRFTLGACNGFKKTDLAEIGGFEKLGNYLAEDNRLGAAFSAQGRKIALCSRIVTLETDPLTWRDYFLHQHRVAATYRVSNPGGYAGMILTHGVTASLALILLAPRRRWRWWFGALVYLVRYGSARRNSAALDFPIPRLPALVLLAGVFDSAFWLLGWCRLPVRWGSRWFRLGRGGEIRN